MFFKRLNGTEKKVTINKYTIDWDGKSRSKFQFAVKQFLKQYWKTHRVFEEFPVTGSRMTVDIFNLNKRLAIEVDGAQHDQFNAFMHNNDRFVYAGQISRDMDKEEWCALNKINLIRIKPEDMPLTEDFFNNLGVNL
jgi:hypothetical protein